MILIATDLPLVFTRGDAACHHLRRSRLDRMIARGEVRLVAPEHYAESVRWHLADRAERHLALVAAAQSRYTRTVASHVSAALLWNLPSPRVIQDLPDLTVDLEVRRSDDSDWARIRRCRLPRRHVTKINGVEVTTLARTAVDCLRSLPFPDALAVADAVVGRGVTPGELAGIRREQSRWPGVRAARRGIGLVDGRRESWLESASAATLYGWIERGTPQVEVYDHGELLGRADVLWRGLKVVGEADGRGKFLGDFGGGADERAVADRLIRAEERAGRMREAGLGVVRWGIGSVGSGQVLAARIRAASPTGACRATFLCAACRCELDDCSCTPRLRLSGR
ncbi:MAG: hypothetical protein ABIU87_12515 [Ornithinibacter sp.]